MNYLNCAQHINLPFYPLKFIVKTLGPSLQLSVPWGHFVPSPSSGDCRFWWLHCCTLSAALYSTFSSSYSSSCSSLPSWATTSSAMMKVVTRKTGGTLALLCSLCSTLWLWVATHKDWCCNCFCHGYLHSIIAVQINLPSCRPMGGQTSRISFPHTGCGVVSSSPSPSSSSAISSSPIYSSVSLLWWGAHELVHCRLILERA